MRAEAMATGEALPRELDEDDARIVLEALRGDGRSGLDELAERAGAQALVDLAASEHGVAWARVPRHVVPQATRLRVLHAVARLFRYDGSAPHLGGDLAESLVASLEARDLDWAELAARYWRHWTMHAGEVDASWPQAASMLARFPDSFEARPGLLGSVATLAATAGATEADDLWARTLGHPELVDDARGRWELELEWARCHLMMGGGRPAQAVRVLRIVQSGFGDLGTAAGELAWTNATLELVCGLAWIGQGPAAVEAFDRALRRVEPGGELETWIRGAGAYACAVEGDLARSEQEAATVAAAATDTSGLVLRALVPARLLRAGQQADRRELQEAVEQALALEASEATDLDGVTCWRVHAIEAATQLADHALARELLAALDDVLDRAARPLPVQQLRRDHVARQLGLRAGGDVEDRARSLGVTLPPLPRVRAADHGRIHVSLFGPFTIRRDDEPVEASVWGGRRQARVLLALLLANGGRVDRDHAAEALWGGLDGQTAAARINPLLNSIRTALSIGGDGHRVLASRGGSIVLELADVDSSDLEQARAAALAVEAAAPGMRRAALEALGCLAARPVEDLGDGAAAESIRHALADVARGLVPRLAAAWDGEVAPDAALDAVLSCFEQDVTDARSCGALLRMLRDRGDVAGASAAFHEARRALRDDLGLAPPRELVRLHASIIGDDATPAVERAALR